MWFWDVYQEELTNQNSSSGSAVQRSRDMEADRFKWEGVGDHHILRTADGYFALVTRMGSLAMTYVQLGKKQIIHIDSWTVLANDDWNSIVEFRKSRLEAVVVFRRERGGSDV